MRAFLAILLLASGLLGLSGCTSDPFDPAIDFMQNSPNSCGQGGETSSVGCHSHPRSH
jgi:hypothetical protein